ncbi:MAG: succinate dehydrogenase assembly factor 2 [Alphaproteobacteria bacterium]
MNDNLDIRRKRLLYRSWHRGTKELDLFIGAFADAHLATLSEAQLDRYEVILERDETDIYGWLSRREPVPPELDNDVMAMILSYDFEKTSR